MSEQGQTHYADDETLRRMVELEKENDELKARVEELEKRDELRLPATDDKALALIARREGTTVAAVIRRAVKAEVLKLTREVSLTRTETGTGQCGNRRVASGSLLG